MEVKEKITANRPLSPEILVPRLGESLVAAGKITPRQLVQALEYQVSVKAQGKMIRIGQALRTLGFIDAETLEDAITVQILQLQNALRQANQELEKRVQERTQELQAALDRLTELNEVKANFIANISHELRTPLTLMKGYLDIISDGGFGLVSSQQADALQAMKRAEERLEKLIDDLILFTHSERGQFVLEYSSVKILEQIRLIIQDSNYKAQSAEVTIKTKIPATLPIVRCDQRKISWVIGELINNAVKFTPKGGTVLVDASCSDNMVKIGITDTGIGIPIERELEIFEPFHQLDASSTRRYGGTGLGLALCNRIITAHGSNIQLRSKVGKGSRFEFSLPIDPNVNGQE
jgi:signal transduction histidine kinase